MNSKHLKFLADLLVTLGYAVRHQAIMDGRKVDHYRLVMVDNKDHRKQVTEKFDVFSDKETLTGFLQANAIECYLESTEDLTLHLRWLESRKLVSGVGHQRRLRRMENVASVVVHQNESES